MKLGKKIFFMMLTVMLLSFSIVNENAYADVEVSISKNKTEPYSNSKQQATVNIKNDNKTPLNSKSDKGEGQYSSKVDSDNYESDVDRENYDSVVDVEDQDVPGTNSYYENTFEDKDSKKDDELNYSEEHYADKIDVNATYEVLDRDMVVQQNLSFDDKKEVKYTTLPKGSEVKVIGLVNQGKEKLVELMADNGKVYYEGVENFYNNAILTKASDLSRYFKSLFNNAKMLGTEQGYAKCVIFAIIFMLGTVFLIKLLDTSVFRLRDSEGARQPYINSIARIMPGAMIGSFIIIANMFDSNAVSYYFYKGFNILGKNYELIHWLLQIMFIATIYMIWRLVLEGIRCFTFPCMLIRTFMLIIANVASFYLCYGLSYVGIAIYVLLVLYQCICVNTYNCADIGDAFDGDEEGEESSEGDEDVTEDGSEEAEPEAL